MRGVALSSIVPTILVLVAYLGSVVAGLVGVPLINMMVDRTMFGVRLTARGVGCYCSVMMWGRRCPSVQRSGAHCRRLPAKGRAEG